MAATGRKRNSGVTRVHETVTIRGMTQFASKADVYHRTRWDYPGEAVDFIKEVAKLGPESCVVDVGAGTGILTKHFVGRVATVYAVEPDEKMMGILKRHLSRCSEVAPLARYSDSIPEIPDGSVDAIVAAHALHWFDYAPTLAEFCRIAKAGIPLFTVTNRGVEPAALASEIDRLFREHRVHPPGQGKSPEPQESYFLPGSIQEKSFGFETRRDSDSFLGSLESASFMPDASDDGYTKFASDAREVFRRFAVTGELIMQNLTTVRYGELRCP